MYHQVHPQCKLLPKKKKHVHLDCCLTRDRPRYNPGWYPGWIAGSAELGYLFGTHLHPFSHCRLEPDYCQFDPGQATVWTGQKKIAGLNLSRSRVEWEPSTLLKIWRVVVESTWHHMCAVWKNPVSNPVLQCESGITLRPSNNPGYFASVKGVLQGLFLWSNPLRIPERKIMHLVPETWNFTVSGGIWAPPTINLSNAILQDVWSPLISCRKEEAVSYQS